jgi:hypothetical protein
MPQQARALSPLRLQDADADAGRPSRCMNTAAVIKFSMFHIDNSNDL